MTFSTAVSPGEQVEVLEDVADRPASHPRLIRARDGGEVDAVDEHLAAGRLLEAAGDRQERALAGAARPHDGDQLAALDREIDVAERLHLGRPGAVDLRYLAQFERARHCETSIGSSWFEWHVGLCGRCEGGPLLQAHVGGIEPADDRFEPEELGVGDERQRHVVLLRRRLDLRVALHGLDHVPAVHLQELVDVDPGDLKRNQHLDHELVARGRHEVGRGAKPVGQLALARGRDPVALPRSLALPVVGLDESVPLEPLEGRVDLPDVERPDLAGPGLELVVQPQAVLRPVTQKRKEGVGDAHGWLQRMNILGTILSIDRERKRHSRREREASPRRERPGAPQENRAAGPMGGAAAYRPPLPDARTYDVSLRSWSAPPPLPTVPSGPAGAGMVKLPGTFLPGTPLTDSVE